MMFSFFKEINGVCVRYFVACIDSGYVFGTFRWHGENTLGAD